MKDLIRSDKLIVKKFYSYMFMGIIIVFALQFGSLADSIIIGNMIGEEALSATSLSLPAIYLLELPGLALSVGGPIVISTLLGKRETEKAKKVMTLTILSSILISLIFVVIGLTLSTQIASLLAGNYKDLIPLIASYIKAYLIEAPLISIGLIISGILGADNNPTLSALYFIIANIFHIGSLILFSLFIKGDNQLFFAGLSMGIGMLSGLIVLIPYIYSKKRTLSLSFKNLFKKDHLFFSVIKSSSASMLNTFLLFFMTLILNLATTNYLDVNSNDLLIYAMMANSVFIVDVFVSGIVQLLPQIVGTLYGERDYYSIRAICKRSIIISLIIALILSLIVAIFPNLYFYIFGVSLVGVSDSDLLVIRIYAISFIVYTLNRYILTYYPSIGINLPTYINLIARNLIIGAPTLYFLIRFNGIMGYSYGTIISESVAFLSTIIFVLIYAKKKKIKGGGILLLPKEERMDQIDISFEGKVANISSSLSLLREKLKQDFEIDDILINYISLAIEEITTNMNIFMKKSKHYATTIDVSIKKNDDKIIVRIRDNNVNFDPTYVGDDEYGIEGLTFLNKISSSVTYLRLLNLNNTIIEFRR